MGRSPVTIALASAASADHYRWGWEEKEEAGGSLVSPDPEHRYNLPEGLDYDYEEGEGADRFKMDARIQGPIFAFALHW